MEKAVEVGHDEVEAALLAKFDTMKAEEAEVQGICDLCEMVHGVHVVGNIGLIVRVPDLDSGDLSSYCPVLTNQ